MWRGNSIHNVHLPHIWKLWEESMMCIFLDTCPNSITRKKLFTNKNKKLTVFILVHTNTDLNCIQFDSTSEIGLRLCSIMSFYHVYKLYVYGTWLILCCNQTEGWPKDWSSRYVNNLHPTRKQHIHTFWGPGSTQSVRGVEEVDVVLLQSG